MCSTIRGYQFCYHGNILGSRPTQYLRHFWPPLVFHFYICKWCLICISQQAYKCVSSSLWPRLAFNELKIPNILKSSGWEWKRASCHGNRHIYSCRCASCRTISRPNFNSLQCKLAKIALFIYLMSVRCHRSSHLYILHIF